MAPDITTCSRWHRQLRARERSPPIAASRRHIRRDRPSIEIDQHTFSLAAQADGSFSLIRETAAGAIQPVVDGVASLVFQRLRPPGDIAVTVQAAPMSLREC